MALINCKAPSDVVITVTTGQQVTAGVNGQMFIEVLNEGFLISASDFTYTRDVSGANDAIINHTNDSNGYTDGVKFTDTTAAAVAGNRVQVDIDLVDTYAPSTNQEITIDLDGIANPLKDQTYTIAGTYDVDTTNATPGDSTGTAYSDVGYTNEINLIISKQITASSGYYFSTIPTCVLTSVGDYASNYSITSQQEVYVAGRLTSITFTVRWTHPTANVSGHNIDFVGHAILIPVVEKIITGYNVDLSTASLQGSLRPVTIKGTPGSSAVLTVTTGGTTYDFSSNTFTASATSTGNVTLDANGEYAVPDIVLPVVVSSTVYTFSLVGGTAPATNTVQGGTGNNTAFTWTISQLADVLITTTATNTGSYIASKTYTSNILTIDPSGELVDTFGNPIITQTLSIVVTGAGGKNLYLRRQPVYSDEVAYNTNTATTIDETMSDFTNTIAGSNNGMEWDVTGLSATGSGTSTITITSGTDGYGALIAGTAAVASVLNLDNFINQAPVAANATYNGTEDVQLTINLSANATKPESQDTLVYSLVADSTGGNGTLATINASTGVVTFSPTANWNGSTTFTWRVNDGYENSNTATATITLAAVADAPTNIALSAATQAENTVTNTVIGAFSTTDVDVGDTFTYTLVSGTGSTDNASFNISGANLRNTAVFDYEVKSSYTIRVRSTDSGGLYFEKAFTITVTDVAEGVLCYRIDLYNSGGSATGVTHYLHPTSSCQSGVLAVTCLDFSTLTNKFVRAVASASGCGSTQFVGKVTGDTNTQTQTAYALGQTYYNSNSDAHNSTSGVTC